MVLWGDTGALSDSLQEKLRGTDGWNEPKVRFKLALAKWASRTPSSQTKISWYVFLSQKCSSRFHSQLTFLLNYYFNLEHKPTWTQAGEGIYASALPNISESTLSSPPRSKATVEKMKLFLAYSSGRRCGRHFSPSVGGDHCHSAFENNEHFGFAVYRVPPSCALREERERDVRRDRERASTSTDRESQAER